jgi:hypothetical protein
MSFENPTRLRIGMHGNFNGRDYRVVGRSVLGETENGETYYWNEFNLQTGSGDEATLSYEETEDGVRWRLFTLFEPEYPMTAQDAATKNIGDWLNLTGDNVRVTFRSSSQVYYIEAKGPEGEELGSEAEYFNAEAGGVMQVVSWTGDEVEYYDGKNLTPGMVAAAFGLPMPSAMNLPRWISQSSSSGSFNWSSNIRSMLLVVGAVLVLFFLLERGFPGSSRAEALPVRKLPAPARPIETGTAGKLFGKSFHVTAHAVVDIAEEGINWERHEYELTDDFGSKYLLVCGDQPDGAEWILYTPFFPTASLTSQQAAAKQMGDIVQLDDDTGRVSEIFLATIEQTDGTGLNGPLIGIGNYGFRCVSKDQILLARWNEAGIQFFHGHSMTAKNGAAGFAVAK